MAQSALGQIFIVFLKLGCTSFGGPVAHIGFFRDEFVVKRRWIDDKLLTDYLSLCQFIPGPASSQLGMAIGYHRHNFLGALVAWLGFTLPSAILLTAFALLLITQPTWLSQGLIQGLKLVALAVVLHAFLGMRSSLAPDRIRISIMILAAALFLSWQSVFAAPIVLFLVGVYFATFGRNMVMIEHADTHTSSSIAKINARVNKRAVSAYASPLIFLLFLVFLLAPLSISLNQPNASTDTISLILEQLAAYYRSGALVFGGGRVVLPLLETEVVETSWVTKDTFLAGYGVAQAVPGPLFTFATFLGASHNSGLNGILGALAATVAIFLPSFLLLFSVMPIWERVRQSARIRSALWGVNAAVLGLLLATLYDPVFVSSVNNSSHLIFTAFAYLALATWRLPVVSVVFGGAFAGYFLL